MPIYEYRCSSCGSEHEALQKLSDAPLSVCPSCHKSTLTKLVSAAGFQLKGSGWYATDFKNSSKPAAKTNGADSKSGTAETKTDGGSADAKSSESKSESKSDSAAPASCGTNCGCH